jgi:hypothetical protein
MHRRRNVLVLLLGLGLLFIVTMLGSNLETFLPQQHPTAANQIVETGPYQITLLVSPNPPHPADPAKLTVQISKKNSQQQLVTNATVVLENNMQVMDMGTNRDQAKLQDDGSYIAHLAFTMSGPWQVRVLITVPDGKTFSAVFEVTVQ